MNARQELDYICSNGHKTTTIWNSWQRGHRCQICAGNRKYTIEFIDTEFKKYGYILNSKKYTGAKSKLNYTCPKGHKGLLSWSSWQQGSRCAECAGKKITIKFIREGFEKESYILLTEVYTSAKSKLEYVCPNGHNGTITWSNWKKGYRCLECSGNKKHTIKTIRDIFEKEKYKLVSKVYVGSHSKLEYVCPKGHIGTITWTSWQRGSRCRACANNTKYTIEFVRSGFEKEGCTLISNEYINAQSKLYYICSKGHRTSTTWSGWQGGHKCIECYLNNNTGENGANWKGGISKDLYCPVWKDKEYKESIKQRDGYKCLNPYCSSEKPDLLTIHHIDYNKKSCGPENLITVCRSCNSAANKDREWHESWYKSILYRRYGYDRII